MLAATPPMGWNSWNAFGKTVDEQRVLATARRIVELGLDKLGYQYVVVDDHWHGGRGADGRLFESREKFPRGLKPLADDIHALGLKFGMYSCAGDLTCGGEVGSDGYEEIDAQTFAAWDADYLKYDYCYATETLSEAMRRYTAMGDALKATGRAIVFSICEWGLHAPWLWGRDAGGQLWRVTHDVIDTWDTPQNWRIGIGILQAIDRADGLETYASAGGWNDLDMLVIGLRNAGAVKGGGCTRAEYATQMAMWCMFASPLMIGCDLETIRDDDLRILNNQRLIAINQDALGQPAEKIFRRDGIDVWWKLLANDKRAFAVLNRSDAEKRIQLNDDLLSSYDRVGKYVDVWSAETIRQIREWNGQTIAPHATKVCVEL